MAPPFCPDRVGRYTFYHYEPSLPAAAIFTALFFISTAIHIWQCWIKRAWFMTPFIIGGIMEFLGYIGRILSWDNPCILGPFIMQTLLLLLGPALFAATIYMILGRIVVLTKGENYSLIRPSWLTKIFVGGDVLCFLLQGGGGGLMSSANGDASKTQTGENLIVGGLFVQLAFFGLFVIVSALFQYRGRHHLASLPADITWKKHLYVLYFTSIFILVRSIFRVVEYLQGNDGYLLSHEVFLYVFDAVLMLAVMVAMNVVHPGDIAIMLKGRKSAGGDEFVQLESRAGKRGSEENMSGQPPLQGRREQWD